MESRPLAVSRRTLMAAAPVAALASASPAAQTAAPAVMVSTWDFGAAANAAGIAARANGGSALDMVETAGRTRIEPARSLFEAP